MTWFIVWTLAIIVVPALLTELTIRLGLGVREANMRGQGEKGCIAVLAGLNGHRADDAEHIASWHPDVAIAVATWLEIVARLLSEGFDANEETRAALAVARAYLGTDQ